MCSGGDQACEEAGPRLFHAAVFATTAPSALAETVEEALVSNRIIVAFDGSDLAREAFAYSVMLAQATGDSILALHVIEPVPPPIIAESMAGIDAAPALVEFDEAARQDDQAESERFQKEFIELEALCRSRAVPFESQIDSGLLIPILVEHAGAEDMIAIGMKGRFAHAGFGSSAKSLIRKSPCDVLVASGPLRPVNRVLSVYDGSSVSKRAVAKAKNLAAKTNWPLTILAAESEHATLDEALTRAQELAEEAQVVSYGAEGKSEARQIAEAASHAGYAVIVMGAYPDSWLHQLFFGFGGTTAHVLSTVNAPVILVH